MYFDIKPLGDRALLVNFDQRIAPDVLSLVLQLLKTIEDKKITGIKELVPAYASLAVFYNPLQILYGDLREQIINLSKNELQQPDVKKTVWKIPVCYDTSLAGDLNSFTEQKKLAIDQFIQLHTAPDYLVYMRGFLPGFLYLGGLDDSLYLARKSTPTAKVPEGTVAIGGQQTGIYSFPSPGGWHIIGRTPVKLFDKNDPEIMRIKAGDHIRFNSVSTDDYYLIKEKIKGGSFKLEDVL